MSKTLLLADDSVTIQKVVGISFASEDIQIVTVDNGDAAVAKARELRPDVILADVVMPGLSGYEVCETLKADPALRHVPIVLLTGTFEAFDEERAKRAGAAGHVAKPFEAQTLVDRVKELLAAPPVAAPSVAAPASPAAAPSVAAPATPADGDAFDFGADDLAAADFSAEADAAEPLDFDEPDTAFAFGDDDLAPLSPVPARDAATGGTAEHDATVAILPEPSPPADAGDLEIDFAGADAPGEASPAEARGSLFEPIGSGSSFDVSSSDLAPEPPAATDSPPSPAESPERTRVITGSPDRVATDLLANADDDDFDFAIPEPLPPIPSEPSSPAMPPAPLAPPGTSAASVPPGAPASSTPPGAPPSLPPDPVMEMLRAKPSAPPPPAALEDDPFDMGPLDGDETGEVSRADAADPARPDGDDTGEGSRTDDADLARPYGAEAPYPDTEVETGDAAEPASFGEADAFGLDDAEPIDPSALEPDAGSGPASATDALESSDATPLSPAMREELRDTLERITWDAFGEVTEKIVKQALEQIERIAWEVVPKLAETLIQEEIRRLKGDGSER